MRDFDSIEILNTLLDGLDPVTGEVLENDHVCCTGRVMYALYEAVLALEDKQRKKDEPVSSKEKVSTGDDGENKLNAGRKWTSEDKKQLKKLYKSGTPIDEICCILQRRPRGLLRELRSLGLDPEKERKPKKTVDERNGMAGKRWSQEDHEWLLEAWLEGERITDIARKLKRSPFAIRCRLFEYGLLESSVNDTPWTEEDSVQLLRMVDENHSIQEMAEHFGRTEKAIEARLFYLGLSKKAPKLLP